MFSFSAGASADSSKVTMASDLINHHEGEGDWEYKYRLLQANVKADQDRIAQEANELMVSLDRPCNILLYCISMFFYE